MNAVLLFSIISDALRFKIVFKSLFQIGFVDLMSPLDVYCIVRKNPTSCGSNDSCLSPFCVSQDKRLFNFPLQTSNIFPYFKRKSSCLLCGFICSMFVVSELSLILQLQ